jgi:hypothetical protein
MARGPRLEESVLVADLDLREAETSHARQLFLQHRRPDLYPVWLAAARRAG